MLASGNRLVPRLNRFGLHRKAAVAVLGHRGELYGARRERLVGTTPTPACVDFSRVLIGAGLAWRIWGTTRLHGAPESFREARSSPSLMAHQLTLDMSLTLFATLMLAAFCVSLTTHAPPIPCAGAGCGSHGLLPLGRF